MQKLEASRQKFNPAQSAGLEQRLRLLTSFLEPEPRSSSSKDKKRNPSRFKGGSLTIIDLSDPFLDASSACGLFEIIIRLFIRSDVGTGKVLVVDEAHKVRTNHLSRVHISYELLYSTFHPRGPPVV